MDWFEEQRHLQPYMACDVFELLVLTGVYSEMSRADMRDYIRDTGLEDDLLRSRAARLTGAVAADEDAAELLLDSFFVHLRSRARLMRGFYPLQVEGGLLMPLPGASHAKPYTLLLHCSRLDTLQSKALGQEAAMAFEEFSAQIAAIGLGPSFRVHGLGTSNNSSQHIFSKSKDKSLRKLAKWFGERVDDDFMLDAAGTSGDHGVDLVGKLNIDRYAFGSPAFLGQCAASSDENYWKKKKYDAEKASEVIRFMCDPIKALFIPCYYRQPDGRWHNMTALSKSVLFDRMRMSAATDPQFEFRHDGVLGKLSAAFVDMQ